MQRKITPKLNFNDITMIVDGRYLCYRTKYSRQGGLSYRDMDTGVFYGFFNTIQSIANKFNVTNTVIMWDIGKEGIRKEEFKDYKNREAPAMTPDEIEEKEKFESSYHYLVAFCDTLGFASYALPRYEADDLIALWCKQYSKGTNVIVTRDEDMYQLITENTFMYDPDKKIQKNLAWFKRTYNLEPEKWVEYKAIAGCKSDTVPGNPGRGEKRTLADERGEDNKWEAAIEKNKALYLLCHNLVIRPHPSLNDYW